MPAWTRSANRRIRPAARPHRRLAGGVRRPPSRLVPDRPGIGAFRPRNVERARLVGRSIDAVASPLVALAPRLVVATVHRRLDRAIGPGAPRRRKGHLSAGLSALR